MHAVAITFIPGPVGGGGWQSRAWAEARVEVAAGTVSSATSSEASPGEQPVHCWGQQGANTPAHFNRERVQRISSRDGDWQ